jgi:hypothetical protein
MKNTSKKKLESACPGICDAIADVLDTLEGMEGISLDKHGQEALDGLRDTLGIAYKSKGD